MGNPLGWKGLSKELDYFIYIYIYIYRTLVAHLVARGGGGVLPYMGHIGMCRCEGYGFQAVKLL